MGTANGTDDAPPWIWFCGGNCSLWEADEHLLSMCRADLFNSVLQASCSILLSLVLVIARFCGARRNGKHAHLLRRYPLHSAQWLCMLLIFLFQLCALAEGILTDATYQSNALGQVYPSQPHFYIPSICGLVTTLLAMVYYHHMETWKAPRMVWSLLVYWAVVLAGQILNLLVLVGMGAASVEVLRFDVCLILMLVSLVLFCCEVNIIRVKVPVHKLDPPKNMKFTQDYSSFLSEYTFWWLDWIFKVGYKRPIELDDLGSLPEVHSASFLHARFREALQIEQERAKLTQCKLSLWRVFWRLHGWRMVSALLMRICADMCELVGPLALINIIPWVENINNGQLIYPKPHFATIPEFFENGLILVGITFIALSARAVLMQAFEHWSSIIGIHLRSAIQTTVYEKSLRVSSYVISSGKMTMGQITNHMSTDVMNVFYMCQQCCALVSLVVQAAIAIVVLLIQLELSALFGVSIFLLIVPLQIVLGNLMANLEEKALVHTDNRIKMSNEFLQGVKLLKMYGWEDFFGNIIGRIRNVEIRAITKMMVCYAILGEIWLKSGSGDRSKLRLCVVSVTFPVSDRVDNILSQFLASLADVGPLLVTFVSYGTLEVVTGKMLTPELAFSSVSFFNVIKDDLYFTPMAMFSIANGYISTNRLAAFFSAPEVDMKSLDAVRVRKPFAARQRSSREGSVAQTTDEYETYFSDGDVEVPLLKTKIDRRKNSNSSFQSTVHEADTPDSYGTLTKSVGNCGIIRALADDVAIKINNADLSWDVDAIQPTLSGISVTIPKGKLTVVIGTVGSGKSSLLSAMLEEMYLLNGSMQINGCKHIAYAAQKAWLINTSMRENILFGRPFHPKRYRQVIDASALQADIDILPAGDQTEIGEKGINVSGGQKQRISVARAMYSGRDIVLLDDPLSALDVHVGEHVFKNGILGTLRKKKKTVVLVTHQLQYLAHADKILLMKDGRIGRQGTFEDICASDPNLYISYQKAVQTMTEESETTDAESRRQDLTYIKKQLTGRRSLVKEEDNLAQSEEKGRLISKEELERGSIAWTVYIFYGKAIGVLAVLALLMLYPLMAGLFTATTVWLSEWSEATVSQGNRTDTVYYVTIYGVISLSCTLVIPVTFTISLISMVMASKHIFNSMLQTIIHMPMRFFDTTPIGRILNRFAADTQLVDMKLPSSWYNILFLAVYILAGLILNAFVNPIFLAIIIPLLVIFAFIRSIFIQTSRELQRLDSVFKSPIFALFSESLGGLPTIRAYRAHQSFFDDLIQRVSTSNTTFLYVQTSIKWLCLRLDFIGGCVVLLSGLTTVLGALNGTVNGSEVGLGISFALLIATFFQQLVRFMAETEMQMNAVERLKHYTVMETESYEGIEPPPDWPTRGCISVENISVRYAEELDPVLQDVSIQIAAGKKVGICGRTGSGKSSLTLALYRIIETFKGRIVIDDIDIATVPLTTLRQRLAIIPQDPVLFNGTIRMNLDPENRRTEQELWDALEIAQLKEFVLQIDGGLDAEVSEGGETFSVGQRQLFCLARAFLRNAHILIMDEATASIDIKTDKILQHVVATAFTGKTVLTIAHRVGTILTSDIILTLSQGKVIEHDTPENLLMDPDSMFASLVHNDQ